MITFKPLWKKLIDENMTKTELRTRLGFSPATLAKMDKRGEFVSMQVLHKICEFFKCQPGEILEYVPDGNPDPNNKKVGEPS